MHTITQLTAREILDSRGTPTIEVRCVLERGEAAVASVPSGASTGIHEALERRDGDESRYGGRGVLRAVDAVNGEIARHVCGIAHEQRSLDNALVGLDATANKSRLGANAILGVSLAFARACALAEGRELYEHIAALAETAPAMPQPFFNIINGGKHADSGLDIQEFMIAPRAFGTVAEKIRAASEITAALRKKLAGKGYGVGVGDEGGFAPKLPSNEEALELIVEAIADAKYDTGAVALGMDVAASSFYANGKYALRIDGGARSLTSGELIAWYQKLSETVPVISIEDGLAEDDFEGFKALNELLGKKAMIVGDDLTVTNIARIELAAQHSAINCVLIKPNQIGTLSETIDAVLLAKRYGWKTFASHRSGETTDAFIADLAVGLACECIKSGAPVRGERVCKYNRLMEIEERIHGRQAAA